MILDALTAAIGDLAVGLGLGIAALAVIALLLRGEARSQRVTPESQTEYQDIWAGFPPKWSAPRAESDLSPILHELGKGQ